MTQHDILFFAILAVMALMTFNMIFIVRRIDRLEQRLDPMQSSTANWPKDPVHQDPNDGKWYFWDETWADRLGPYDTRPLAELACKVYVKSLG